MSETERRVQKWGSITILSGLGGTLVAALILWVFGNSYKNSMALAPLVVSVDRLSTTIGKTNTRNTREHNIIVEKLQNINGRININETKLHEVIKDCDENHKDIKFFTKD